MINNVIDIRYNDLENIRNTIEKTLSSYIEKFVQDDGNVKYKEVNDKYFFESDSWNVSIVGKIEQFKEEYSKYNQKRQNIVFSLNNKNINLELKYVYYKKLFNEEWSFYNVFKYQKYNIKLIEFLNFKYPNIDSFLELDINKSEIIWRDWLQSKGIDITTKKTTKSTGKTYEITTAYVTYLRRIYDYILKELDKRDEFEKDIWDVRILKQHYGISYSISDTTYLMSFKNIPQPTIRQECKLYFKEKLLSKNNFSYSTARQYCSVISTFFRFIKEIEPSWDSIEDLNRNHILKYITYLNQHYAKSSNIKANVNYNIRNAINKIYKFLSDIQLREYKISPNIDISRLILETDKPTLIKKANNIKYITDDILEQLFDNIDKLNKKVQIVIWIMYKTGLRISDVLELKHDCLIMLDNNYWIETNILKTNVQNHRIPIDKELADMIAILIDKSVKKSNEDNNPEKYIFAKYSGIRKGRPYSDTWAINHLNALSREVGIINSDGTIYHFSNHAFRHTYAVKLLNGGADITTIQELLAHASPEMTLKYAKLLDDTKRKVFDNAVKQGIFSFDESDKLKEENNGEIPDDIIEMLYTNHKLNAIDTPYGTCMQRTKGKCNFAKQPPCLTSNNGSPCKDLCVGAFEGDIIKYDILINSTKNMIENAKIYNRTEMINENEELLKLYEDIHSKISQGNMIYSRLDKLKKKVN